MTSMVSTPPPPKPPWSGENGTPRTPSDASPSQSWAFIGIRSASILRRFSKLQFFSRKRCTLSLSICCSSVSEKSISTHPLSTPPTQRGSTGSKSKNHLRDDIALDLVGTAVDAGLAIVEIPRRKRGGIVGTNVRSDPVITPRHRQVRQRIGPHRLHHQFGEILLDLGALYLQYRRLGPGRLAVAVGGRDAQIGDLQRHQIYFHLRHPVAKQRILDQRLSA